MTDAAVTVVLQTPLATVRDVCCAGRGVHPHAAAEIAHPRLEFPYRGVHVRQLPAAGAGDAFEDVVADASQVLFVNAGVTGGVRHPVPGGDGSLRVQVAADLLAELVPAELLRADPGDGVLQFRQPRLRIDARAQVLVALLRHSLIEGVAEPLEAESLALTLVRRALGPRTAHAPGASQGRQRLVDRTKLVLLSDLSRRWSLAGIAAEVGVSPVYLTQVFQQVEGLPLYRYQLRLRLARALDLLAEVEDLSALSLDLGFSSHSHFSAAFQQAYGRSPTAFRHAALQR